MLNQTDVTSVGMSGSDNDSRHPLFVSLPNISIMYSSFITDVSHIGFLCWADVHS